MTTRSLHLLLTTTKNSMVPLLPHHPCHLLQDPAGLHPKKQNDEIQQARLASVPKSTQADTKFCVKLWEDWKSHTEQATNVTIGQITQLSTADLQHWMSKFVLEIRKRDGSEYPPNSLYHISAGNMCYLHWNGEPSIKFFCGSEFTLFR